VDMADVSKSLYRQYLEVSEAADKRLAVMGEDYDLEYGEFEGARFILKYNGGRTTVSPVPRSEGRT